MAAQKLTLSIEPDVIDKAKKYAKQKHTSLSKMVQEYLNDISGNEIIENDPLLERLKQKTVPKNIKSLSGILKGKYPDDYNFKEAKYEYLKEKYGL